MVPEMEHRTRGLMQLEQRYARLLGRYQSVERLAESAVGLKALVEADTLIEADRRKIKSEMDAIEHRIVTQFYHNWVTALVRPVAPQEGVRLSRIAIEAYRVIRVLRGRSMTTAEVTREVCERLELEHADDRLRSKIAANVVASFNRRVKEGMLSVEGRPARWTVIRRPALDVRPGCANILPKPVAYASTQPASQES